MRLVDANLLLYSCSPALPEHRRAREWLEATFLGTEAVWFSWVTLLAFLRISTNPRAFGTPFSIEDAISNVSGWLSQPGVGILEPGERHWTILSGLMVRAKARADLVTDAHIAALAIEHGAILCSNDRDFTRFPGLKLENPLGA